MNNHHKININSSASSTFNNIDVGMDLNYLLFLLEETNDNNLVEKQQLENYLEKLVENIFKLQYWEMERGRDYQDWQTVVFNSRKEIQALLQQNPHLKLYLERIYPQLYRNVVDFCQTEFYIPQNVPIELSKMLQKNYFG